MGIAAEVTEVDSTLNLVVHAINDVCCVIAEGMVRAATFAETARARTVEGKKRVLLTG